MHALYSVLSRFLERETVAIRIGLAPRAIGLIPIEVIMVGNRAARDFH